MNTRKSIALAQERTREKRQLVGKYSRKEKTSRLRNEEWPDLYETTIEQLIEKNGAALI